MTVMQHIWIVLGVLFVMLNVAAGLIWVERRLLALWQDRLGPNRAGPLGILIVLADTLKLFFKMLNHICKHRKICIYQKQILI